MKYKDVLIQLASMTVPYVYDNTISFLELDRKLYKIVHELIGAMQGLNKDYEQFKTDMTNSINEFTTTINNNFDEFKTDVDNQINTFEENMNTNFESFKTEIADNFNTLEGEINTLKEYVNNYFENLNLDEEVQAVIQKMYSDGTLTDIINDQVFNELNTKLDELEAKVNNMELITTITSELTFQLVGDTVRYYNDALRNPSDNELFVVTFPDTDSTYTNVELYYQQWSGSGLGWKITNISGVQDIKGQTLLVQARGTGTITFEVIGVLPTREIITDKISDLLVTNCGTGAMQQVGETYYVYSESFGNSPKNNQLFTIKIPKLTNNKYDVKFYNRNQIGGYTGWELNNAKPLDISGQNILVQASVNAGTITFEVIGILPPLFDFSLMDADDCEVAATVGLIEGKVMKATLIGNKQALFMGSFMIHDPSNSSITITPPLNLGTGRFRNGNILYAQDITVLDNHIYLNQVGFTYSSSNNKFTTTINDYGYHIILIMPQYLDTVEN